MPARVLERLIGFRNENNSAALSPSPSAAYAIVTHVAACEYWPAVFPDPGRIALDITGVERRPVERRRKEQHEPSSRLTRCSSTAARALAARSGSAAPEITAHDCAIESIRHSSLAAEPSGVPSSK
jgi:hypothetical protein